jgi:hypothetical protein
MYYKRTFTVLLTTLYMCDITQQTHFRGSMISWRILDGSSSPVTVEILQRHAWRYNYYNSPLCTDATIRNVQPILGNNDHNIDCVSDCPTGLTALRSVQVSCTGYNIGEQYAMGESRFTV